jgi:hypothetical protein
VNKKLDGQRKRKPEKRYIQRGKLLPKEYKWEGKWAKKEKKKGRATRGIITGVKLEIKKRKKKKDAWNEKFI